MSRPRSHRSAPSPAARPAAGARAARVWRAIELATDFATLALAVWFLAVLAERASGARFQSDECFHAYVSERIAAHPGWPRAWPEFYSGFYYYYPPLFHLLGAAWCAVFSPAALRYLNVFFTALLLATVYLGCRALGARAAGRWAVALCVANSWLAAHAVRLYVEQLTTLLMVAAILLVLRLHGDPRPRRILALGLVAGLALLAKHSSLILIVLLIVLAVAYLLRQERAPARAFAIAAAVAVLVALPMLVRNQVLYGSPFYPALAPDLHPLLYALNKARFTPAPLVFYRDTALDAGPWIGLMMLGALALAVARRRFAIETGLLVFCLVIYAAGPLQPLLDSRHMLPAIVAVAVLGSLGVARGLEGRPAARALVGLVLLVVAAQFVVHMPHYRRFLDLPAESAQAFDAVREHVPEGERVLSLATYETYFYARRPATWPIPWGQREHPVEMFLTSDTDSVLLALRRHRLRYLLVSRVAQGREFDGANYPLPFLESLAALLAEQRAEVLWSTPRQALVRIADR